MGHRNARTTIRVRFELVQAIEGGMPVASAARMCGTSRQTAYKWLWRFRAGEPLTDRSSRPRRMPRLTPASVSDLVVAMRRRTGDGPAVIAGKLGMAWSTVYKILRRAGMSRLPRQPKPPVVRYEHKLPGDLIHIDVKRLARIGAVPGHRVTGDRSNQHRKATSGSGYDYVHVAIDDRSRVGFAWIYDAENADTAADFALRVHSWYSELGFDIKRVITDNGKGFKTLWRDTWADLGVSVKYTRPYRPQTNGKAERFIRTMLAGWAYADVYHGNTERCSALPKWIDAYNTQRYHTSCKTTPWQRAATDLQAVNNVRGHYT